MFWLEKLLDFRLCSIDLVELHVVFFPLAQFSKVDSILFYGLINLRFFRLCHIVLIELHVISVAEDGYVIN